MVKPARLINEIYEKNRKKNYATKTTAVKQIDDRRRLGLFDILALGKKGQEVISTSIQLLLTFESPVREIHI